MRGRDYVLPADVVDVAADVLRHRLVPSYEALAEGMTADQIVRQILRAVPAPEKVLDTARAAGRLNYILRRLELPVAAAAGRPAAGRSQKPVARRGPGSGRSAGISVS